MALWAIYNSSIVERSEMRDVCWKRTFPLFFLFRNIFISYNGEGDLLHCIKRRMNMFENKLIKTTYGTVHMSRIIASYTKAGGKIEYYPHVQSKWQKYCREMGISDDDAYAMYNMATCGKMELESAARKFLEN